MTAMTLLSSLVLGSAIAGCDAPTAADAHDDGASGSASSPHVAGNGAAFDPSLVGGGGVGGDALGSGGSGGTGAVAATPSGGSSGAGLGGSSADGTPSGTGTGGTAGLDGGSSLGGMAGGGAGSHASSGPTFHVFLLLGQSNMAGYPKAQDADEVEDPRITVLGYDDCAATGRKTDEWDVAAPPLHECWNGAIGPADHFAKTLIDELPDGDTIGLVPCAISGERIETFMKVGGAKYGFIVERAKLAQQAGGVIDGILFHQGESNNGDPSWPGKVATLVADLKADLELGDVPFLAGELPYDGGCAGHNTLVDMLPAVVTNGHVVSADGLDLDPADTMWRLHFGHDAQVSFGQRYAAKMIEALKL
jgi:hypothetical protein